MNLDEDEARRAAMREAIAGAPMVAGPGDDDCDGPSETAFPPETLEAVAECAGFDHSDTDNGRRLLRHFGGDLAVLRQSETEKPTWVTWTGVHWDDQTGHFGAHAIAQQLGGRIALEAAYLRATPDEADAIKAGEKAARKPKDKQTDADALAIEQAKAAREALEKRKIARRKFGVSSKNSARLASMLTCAAPFLLRPPEDFNADPYLFVTRTHTVRLVREDDGSSPEPDVVRFEARAIAHDGHRRTDLVTKVVPVDWIPDAVCPRWMAFLEEMMPAPAVRDFVQETAGLGLLGATVQKIIMHYGEGANGKSVFLETIGRVLGALAIGLPAESITGTSERGGGQASPDLVRLFGARFLRIHELPEGKNLDEALVKKLTGGDKVPVRGLFKGYMEFQGTFIAHGSCNGYPRIDGVDRGIWRRMAVVHWPVSLPEERQRDFDTVLSEFRPEYPGILQWLVAGALRWMTRGLVIPDAVRAATEEYREEMDNISSFVEDCVEAAPGFTVGASDMYRAYEAYCAANAIPARHMTKFGKVMKTKFRRDDKRVRVYLDCRLHDVPPSAGSRSPEDGWFPDR